MTKKRFIYVIVFILFVVFILFSAFTSNPSLEGDRKASKPASQAMALMTVFVKKWLTLSRKNMESTLERFRLKSK